MTLDPLQIPGRAGSRTKRSHPIVRIALMGPGVSPPSSGEITPLADLAEKTAEHPIYSGHARQPNALLYPPKMVLVARLHHTIGHPEHSGCQKCLDPGPTAAHLKNLTDRSRLVQNDRCPAVQTRERSRRGDRA